MINAEKFKDINTDRFVCVFLVLFTLITQFYTHNQETLGWDVNTFIVMSQDVLRGNLPYENYFDNKGPVLYFLYAIPTFFQKLIIIKIFNDLALAFLAIQMFQISKRVTEKNSVFLDIIPSTFFLLYMSHPQGHPGMSEIYSLIFVSLSIKKFITTTNSKTHYFGGFYLSISYLVTPSVILLILSVTFLVIVRIQKFKNYELFRYFLYGGFTPFILVSILYILKNEFNKLFFALFLFPINYSSNLSILNNVKTLIEHLLQLIYVEYFKLIGLLSTFLFIAFVYFLIRSLLDINNIKLEYSIDFLRNLIVVLILSSIISFLLLPVGHWHYLIYYYFSISFLPLFINNFKVRYIFWLFIFVSLINIAPLVVKGSLKNIVNLNNISEQYEIYQDYKAISTKYQINSALALDDHLMLFYFNIGSDNYIVHPSNYQKISYMSTLLKEGYIKENELSNIVEYGETDLLICTNEYKDICSVNLKNYKKIKVNDRGPIFYINKKFER